MAKDTRYRYIIRFLSGAVFPEQSLMLCQNEVELRAYSDDAPTGMRWMEVHSKEDYSEEEVYRKAIKLCVAIELTFFSRKVGVDTGVNPSKDRLGTSSGWLNPFVYQGIVDAGGQFELIKHGIAIFDSSKPLHRGMLGSPQVCTSMHVNDIAKDMERNVLISGDITDSCISAVRNFNHGMVARDPLARLALMVASVEHLAESGGKWTNGQMKVIRELAESVLMTTDLDQTEAYELSEQIKLLRNYRVRLGFKRLFERLGLQDDSKEWLSLYDKRSGIFHGGGLLSPGQMSELVRCVTEFAHKVVSCQIAFEKSTGLRNDKYIRV